MVAMDKILPPYKASFSVSNAVVMALSECCFKVGRLSCIANQREGKESAAEEAKAYCRLIDVKLTPSLFHRFPFLQIRQDGSLLG